MTLTFKVGTGSSFNPAAATDLGNQVVRLGTVSLSQAAEAGSVSFSGIQFDDPTSTVVIPALRPFWVDETAASPARLWTGYLTDRQYARQPSKSLIVGAAREIDPTLVDLNAVFGIRILRGSGTRRPVETVSARLTWLLGAMSPSVFDNGQVGSITDRTMPKTDYRFMFPEDVLKDCAGTVSANYFAYWDGSANQVSLFFQRNTYTGYTSSLRLTNHASDVDNVTTFFADISLKKDPSRVYSGIGYTHAGGFVYRQNATTATTFISRDMTVTTGAKPSRAVAIQRADQLLLGHAAEAGLVIVKTVLPKDKVNLALVGQYIQVKADHLEAYTSFTSNRITHRTVQQDKENPDIYTVTFELFDPQVTDGGPPALPLDTSPFQQSCDVGAVDYGTDLALSKTLVAQGTYAAAAANMPLAVDGSDATSAQVNLAVRGAGTWVCRMRFDNGSPLAVSATRVFIGSPFVLASVDKVSVQYSDDDAAWTDAVSWADLCAASGAGVGNVTIEFPAQTHRYWGITYTRVVPGGLEVVAGTTYWTWSLYGAGATDCSEPTYAQPIPPEQAGTGNGTTKCYTTNYPYLPGSLRVTVNGISTTPEETSPSTGGFCIPFAPPAGAQIVVTYQADNGTATGANNPPPSPSYTATFPASTHKGDLIVSDGSNWQVHSGGSNYQVLTRDTAMPLGVKWAEPSNGGGVTGITSNGSNTLSGLVNLVAGSGIALGVASQDITITNTGSGGGGGGGASGLTFPEIVQVAQGPSNAATTITLVAIQPNAVLVLATDSTTGQITSPTLTGVTWTVMKQGNNGTGYYSIWVGKDSGSGGGTAFSCTKPGSFNTMQILELNPASLGTITPTASATVDRACTTSQPQWQYISGLTAGRLIIALLGLDNTAASCFMTASAFQGYYGAATQSPVSCVVGIATGSAMGLQTMVNGSAGRFLAAQVS